METEQRLRNAINTRRQQIADGVSVADKDRMEQEILTFEEQLRTLEQSLPETPVEPAEPILSMVDGLPLESFTRNEDSAILIRCEVEAILEMEKKWAESRIRELGQRNFELQEIHRNNKIEKEAQTHEIGTLRELIVKLDDQIVELEQTKARLTLERDEALKYRDNAAKQLEELAQELELSRIEVNKSREAKVYTEAERTTQAEEARQRLINSRIKVYNIRWEDDNRKTHKLAELAETGETIRFNYLEHGKYTEITEDEAQAIQAMNKPIEMPEVQTEESFQGETESLPEVQQGTDSADHEYQQPAVGEVETFEQWATREINSLKLAVYKNNPEYVYEAEVA